MRAIALALLLTSPVLAQRGVTPALTLAEQLGYPSTAKLLIVNGDDLGISHSIDSASVMALKAGAITSASVMVPGPRLSKVAAFARANPRADLGLHLTLTNEWSGIRWMPLLRRGRVPSLLDRDGHLFQTAADAATNVDPRQAEAEVRAQIARARAVGIRPTHLDSHMGVLYQTRALLDVLLRVARDERLPARVSREQLTQIPFLAELIKPGDVLIDRRITIPPSVPPEGWNEFYAGTLRSLEPGVTELIVHLGYDDAELRAVTDGKPDWGAAWRQRDLDFFTSEDFRRLVRENGITLITWREIGKLIAARPK